LSYKVTSVSALEIDIPLFCDGAALSGEVGHGVDSVGIQLRLSVDEEVGGQVH
jgi:hypothetical protein